MDRAELAQFLRTRRARLRPHDVGLPSTARRRVSGLRRHEVSQLAGVSVEYYIRLEQGRGANPSRQVLSSLARALILTADERDYLFRLAGHSSPVAPALSSEVTSGVRYLLDSLTETPAYVVDAKYELLAWNRVATMFIGDPATFPEGNRNMLRWMFQGAGMDEQWRDESHLNFARQSVADLRAAYANYPGDPGIAVLVTELLGCSPHFAEMWASHDVQVRRRIVKRVEHPLAGWLEFECQVLHVSTADQRIIVYCAEPGSPTHQAFRRLAERVVTHGAEHEPVTHGAEHQPVMHGAEHENVMHGAEHENVMHGAEHQPVTHRAEHRSVTHGAERVVAHRAEREPVMHGAGRKTGYEPGCAGVAA